MARKPKKKSLSDQLAKVDEGEGLTPESVIEYLRKPKRKKKGATTAAIAEKFRVTQREALAFLGSLGDQGYLVSLIGDSWAIEKKPLEGTGQPLTLTSDADGWHLIGLSSDQHLGSKYCRMDVLTDIYRQFAESGVSVVLNSGNWIEGEARFNRHDIDIFGMDQQIENLVQQYPQVEGITTYAIHGDDHEGWYGQREGIDIGRHTENLMRRAGRYDWVDLGFVEAYVELKHRNTGKGTFAHVLHPGGGSAYAVSYKPQKIVESYPGGAKPAAVFIGHYHKLSYNHFRNVVCIQCGCTQDQSTFLKKHNIEPHIGAVIVRVKQDPKTGALVECQTHWMHYFDKGYYQHRFSKAGKVTRSKKARA
mgnify:CR=1 FL=1